MQNIKAFRPSSGPALEMCSHYEPTFSTSPNAQRGTEFHQTIAVVLRDPDYWVGYPERTTAYSIELYKKLIDIPGGIEDEVPLLDSDGEFVTSGTIDCWGRKKIGKVLERHE